MNIRSFLPSAQFTVLVGAIFLSIGFIGAAEMLARPPGNGIELQNTDGSGLAVSESDTNWQNAFASSTAFQAAATIQDQARQLIDASQTKNITDSIGRSLLVNAAAAQGQGLSGDTLVQNQIIADTLAQIQNAAPGAADAYATIDVLVVPDSAASLHAFGNAFVAALSAHPQATYDNTMLQVSLAVDAGDPATLAKLPAIAKEYRALAADIIKISAPASARDSELQVANGYAHMADESLEMQYILSDPARGVVGLQRYSAHYAQNLQAFGQIADTLKKNGILFTTDEPGSVWSVFLSSRQ